MSYETLRFELMDDDTVGVVTLDRPEVRNAIDAAMVSELHMVLDSCDGRPSLRALVIRSSSPKAFAAGADIAELKQRNVADALARINVGLFRRIEEHPLPSVAAVQGYALGGGCELAMACDLRIAGRTTKLGQPEVSLGILPGAGAIQRLPRLVGLGRAKELILTGRIVDAEEAERIGLVNRVVDEESVFEEALSMARSVARHGPMAVRLSKLALNASGRANPGFEQIDILAQALCFESEDKHLRMQAFLERKKSK
ncbi:MAG: enoyl-CoA hydratase/isomerase family protein [Myxococcota bacterium]